jgi:hypothetical protein
MSLQLLPSSITHFFESVAAQLAELYWDWPQSMLLMCGHVLQDHTLPRSLYLMKQVLDVRPSSKYEWHSCLLGCTGWPPTPRSEWKAHRHDCCKKCGGARFKIVMGEEASVRVSAGQCH